MVYSIIKKQGRSSLSLSKCRLTGEIGQMIERGLEIAVGIIKLPNRVLGLICSVTGH